QGRRQADRRHLAGRSDGPHHGGDRGGMTSDTEGHARIDATISDRREATALQAMIRTQPFWVFIAIIAIGVVMTFVSDVFLTERNMFNVTRNLALSGLRARGATAGICTRGLDQSVGPLAGPAGPSTR